MLFAIFRVVCAGTQCCLQWPGQWAGWRSGRRWLRSPSRKSPGLDRSVVLLTCAGTSDLFKRILSRFLDGLHFEQLNFQLQFEQSMHVSMEVLIPKVSRQYCDRMWKPAHSGSVVHNLAQGVTHTWPVQRMLTPIVGTATTPILACPCC